MFDIYENDNGDQWRYTLGRSGSPALLVIGLNPSTATLERSDPTVTRVAGVAERHGFPGFVMLNLYPVRATDFRTLPAKVDRTAFERNLERIEAAVAAEPSPVIWATWGESVAHHGYFLRARDQLFERLAKYGPSWCRLGELTATGHPRHASRLNRAWTLGEYDITG